MYGDQFGEFACGYRGLKGSKKQGWISLPTFSVKIMQNLE